MHPLQATWHTHQHATLAPPPCHSRAPLTFGSLGPGLRSTCAGTLPYKFQRPVAPVTRAINGSEDGAADGGSPPGRSSRGRGPPSGDDAPGGAHTPSPGKLLAAAAAAYMLLALFQPWRLWGRQLLDTSACTVSIIIPVLNEANSIVQTLERLKQQLQPPAAELIVVDGGSTDGTLKLVQQSGLADRVIRAGRGRAVQMNEGAAAAKGDLLCFLHADTQPPPDLVAVMRQELRDPQTVLAGFVPSIEVPGRRLWLLSFHNFISTYYAPLLFRPLAYLRGLRNLFGDQTMFCRACDFKAVGGFDTRWSIMEDTDLCCRMHEAGPCRHQLTTRTGSSCGAAHTAGQHRQQGAGSRLPSHGPLGELQQRCQQWLQPRGRVKQVLTRLSVTSGRRLAVWGTAKATYIHAVLGTSWYFRRDPVQLRELYDRLYTDAFR